MVHLKLKQYKCLWPGCDSAFVSQKQLEVHSSDLHIGEKRYRCDWPECDWIGTNHAQELRFHKLRIHEGIKIVKNHKSRKSNKSGPKNSNQNENRYVCEYPECGKQFKYKSFLTRHSKAHKITGYFITV